MLAPSFSSTIETLLAHVARFGMTSSDEQVDALVGLAHRHGVAPEAADATMDQALPMIVRERALSQVIGALRSLAASAPDGAWQHAG